MLHFQVSGVLSGHMYISSSSSVISVYYASILAWVTNETVQVVESLKPIIVRNKNPLAVENQQEQAEHLLLLHSFQIRKAIHTKKCL